MSDSTVAVCLTYNAFYSHLQESAAVINTQHVNRFDSFIKYKGYANPTSNIIELFYTLIGNDPNEFKYLSPHRWKKEHTRKCIVSSIKQVYTKSAELLQKYIPIDDYNKILSEMDVFYDEVGTAVVVTTTLAPAPMSAMTMMHRQQSALPHQQQEISDNHNNNDDDSDNDLQFAPPPPIIKLVINVSDAMTDSTVDSSYRQKYMELSDEMVQVKAKLEYLQTQYDMMLFLFKNSKFSSSQKNMV